MTNNIVLFKPKVNLDDLFNSSIPFAVDEIERKAKNAKHLGENARAIAMRPWLWASIVILGIFGFAFLVLMFTFTNFAKMTLSLPIYIYLSVPFASLIGLNFTVFCMVRSARKLPNSVFWNSSSEI